MAKLFIGIALAVMLATAALGFLAKGNIDKLQSSLTEKKGQIDKAVADQRKAESETKKAQEELTAANTKIEEANKALDDKKKEADDAKKLVDEAKTLAADKESKIAQLEKDLTEAKTGRPSGPIEDPRIGQLEGDLKKAQADLADNKVVIDTLTKKQADADARAAAADSKLRSMQVGAVRAGLQGRILAVNAGWNFVVLSVGDKQGVVVNAPLLVVRGNEPIARLRVTSVEPSTSIADVLPGSVRRGISVQPGDTVIFEGRSAATQAPKLSPSDAESPVTAPSGN